MLGRKPAGKIGHSRAAQNDGFRAVLGYGAADFGTDAVAGFRAGMFKVKDRDLG